MITSVSLSGSTDFSELEWSQLSLSSRNYEYIEPVTLTKGIYYLSIVSEPYQSLSFTIDFLLEREYSQHMAMYLASSLEMCP
jgi:hypothetical protein